MRHAGSDVVALKAKLGVAAGLRVHEEDSTGTPRFAKWKPFDVAAMRSLEDMPP
jgi:hypothetical protein